MRAGLENLARTLSVEWARFAIRPVAILPGSAAGPAEVAELACFLASPAGEYYSGCAFELSGASCSLLKPIASCTESWTSVFCWTRASCRRPGRRP